jgi:hypothetical protein
VTSRWPLAPRRNVPLCRVVQPLPGTRDVALHAAMSLGVSDHIWSIGELIDATLSTPSPTAGGLSPQSAVCIGKLAGLLI